MQGSNLPQSHESMLGKLLVASSRMEDPVLSRSVCLVVHQDSDNVFAVMLNRPMTPPPGMKAMLSSYQGAIEQSGDQADAPTSTNGGRFEVPEETEGDASEDSTHLVSREPLPHQIAQQEAAAASQSLGTIHFGGPLSGPVVAVHDSKDHAEAVAGKGVYLAAQRDLLETLVQDRPDSLRLIVGHLGWTVEQLFAERDAGYWHMIDANHDDVFAGDQELWPSVIRRATTRSVSKWIGIPDQPFAAEVN